MLLPIREEVTAGLLENKSRNRDYVVGELGVVSVYPAGVALQKSVDNLSCDVIKFADQSAARGDSISRNLITCVEQIGKSARLIAANLHLEPRNNLLVEHRDSHIIISRLKQILNEVIG